MKVLISVFLLLLLCGNALFFKQGGEDNDFFGRMKKKLHIIRARDAGLIHLWHKESCDSTKPSCTGSKARLEGPPLSFMIK